MKGQDILKREVLSLCGKKSLGNISKEVGVSKSTCKRWCDELLEDETESDLFIDDGIDTEYDSKLGLKLLVAFLIFLSILFWWIFRQKTV